jgi:large subunit ribosomal protein L30
MATIKVKLTRSYIGCTPNQKDTLRALGLKRIRQVRELPKNESTLGMVLRVNHLVEVIEA